MLHFKKVILDICEGQWKHFGNYLKPVEKKSIPHLEQDKKKILTDVAMPNQLLYKTKVQERMKKYMDRQVFIVNGGKGNPYMNEYRHLWGLEKVSAESWAAEEKNLDDLTEADEHDSGEVVSEDSDDGDMPGVVTEEEEDSDSD